MDTSNAKASSEEIIKYIQSSSIATNGRELVEVLIDGIQYCELKDRTINFEFNFAQKDNMEFIYNSPTISFKSNDIIYFMIECQFSEPRLKSLVMSKITLGEREMQEETRVVDEFSPDYLGLSFNEFIKFCFELSKEFPKINFDEGFKKEFEKISSQSKNIELDSEDEELKAKLDLKNMVHDMRREICRRAIYKPSGMINFEVVKMLFSEESLLYRQPK